MVKLLNIIVRVKVNDEVVNQTSINELNGGESKILVFDLPSDAAGAGGALVEIEYTDEYGNAYPKMTLAASWGATSSAVHLDPAKEAYPAQTVVGSVVNIRIHVHNSSPDVLKDITVSDSLPENCELVEGSTSFTIDSLLPGESRILEYKVRFTKPGFYTLPEATISYGVYLSDSRYTTKTNPVRVVVV